MRSDLTKGEVTTLVRARLRSFQAIAEALGKEHTITKMMGSLAWGRHGAEWGPGSDHIRTVSYALGFLDGCFDILNKWASDNDHKAQRVMTTTYKADFAVKRGDA
jgi:hypothetical protein